jgi:hypothetical protein
MAKSPAVTAAKKKESIVDADNIYTSKGGIRVRIHTINQLLIEEAVNELQEPKVPVIIDEDKGYTIENPDSPQYKRDMEAFERKQYMATLDAALLWGIELLDPIPDDDTWIKKLRFFSKRNPQVNIDQYDMDEPIEREFVYKKFVAINTDELVNLMDMIVEGVSEEDKEKARNFSKSRDTANPSTEPA